MTDNPYSTTDVPDAQQASPSAERTFVFSWWALGVATFVAVLVSISAGIVEQYYQLWIYTSRLHLARSLGDLPPTGGVLNPIDELKWAAASTFCIQLPRIILTLLIFVPLFLRLCRPRPDGSE